MPRLKSNSLLRDDQGSAIIDFLGFGVLLQVPILLLSTQLLVVQRDQLAAQSLSRQLLRTVLISQDAEMADRRVDFLLADARRNFQLQGTSIAFSVGCDPVCWQPGIVTVTVKVGASSEVSKGFRT